MAPENKTRNEEEELELVEWLESLDYVLEKEGTGRARFLIQSLQHHAFQKGLRFTYSAHTPYMNTIPTEEEPAYPGNVNLEWMIRSYIRWNAMAMVIRAQRDGSDVGGHISSFASCATLYEVGFNHFFRARSPEYGGDSIYFQGHVAPGIYARAFLEGRLTEQQLNNFRKELHPGGGLSSYPHPRLMRDFWQFPTVSMGLGPLMAIYHARFNRYLEDRGLKPKNGGKVWCFMGDGESDEPESLGAIGLAGREKLDNLIFVVNCNLQRLDGPVRGNGKIIQELEGHFRGAGWNVLKVIWGRRWNQLFARDEHGILAKRAMEAVDGDYQKYSVEPPSYVREHFFGKYPELAKLVAHLTDDDLMKLNRGGHDPYKIFTAYQAATEYPHGPTVILAKTVKGYGLGESAEAKNITHSQKKLTEAELRKFRTRFSIPLSDKDVADAPFYMPPHDSPEMQYMRAQREKLGGSLPRRMSQCISLKLPEDKVFEEFHKGSEGREVSTTMVYVRMLTKLMKDKEIGKYIVPIVPDEARTFGMESLFRAYGIYASKGQLYSPVDSDTLLYYKESTDGQILEEGINEAGAMSSFIAAGCSYATNGIPMIPFYTFYSMFGFQRVGDLAWAAGDLMCRGFLIGGTSGRTTLNGEGLQHQDGHSHVLASTIPNLITYDPSFSYELAVILKDGLRRMYVEQQNVFYYLTVCNENYEHPAMPEGVEDGILKGIYKLKKVKPGAVHVHLFGSGSLINSALEAQTILEKYKVTADVWSVTSYGELRRDGLDCDRWNLLNPLESEKIPYVTQVLKNESGSVVVASSDYMKALPDSIEKWVPQTMISLGTDGFGMSETRTALRDHFEVDARHMVYAALGALVKKGELNKKVLQQAAKDLEIRSDKRDPMSLA
ncbi:MAG: pyruvate dehydrogenase (acetyl-transferring), homodimeric type [SAR324 cluster bacterium]|nr:pyruvate dehydrogenase (acetyl-transferring), homodimeric type [SAR324 cluster bacterium]